MTPEATAEVISGVLLAVIPPLLAILAAYLARALKHLMASKETSNYADAINTFLPILHNAAFNIAHSYLDKNASGNVTDAEYRDFVVKQVVYFQTEFQKRSGVRFELPADQLDLLVETAITQAKGAFAASWGTSAQDKPSEN